MAKVWRLDNDYSNAPFRTETFINGVAWFEDQAHIILAQNDPTTFYVDGTTRPDAIDKATETEIIGMCSDFNITISDKHKFELVQEIKAAASASTTYNPNGKYSPDVNKQLMGSRWAEAVEPVDIKKYYKYKLRSDSPYNRDTLSGGSTQDALKDNAIYIKLGPECEYRKEVWAKIQELNLPDVLRIRTDGKLEDPKTDIVYNIDGTLA